MRMPWTKEPDPGRARLERWASHYVGAGTGMKMMLAQAANEVLRNCRIGNVTRKP